MIDAPRIKVTGYYTPEPSELDPMDRTGLTNEAYERVMGLDDDQTPLTLSELEDVELELE